MQGMSISSVRPLILGRAGTSVTLGLRRESEDTVVYVRVMREPVRLGEVLVPGVRVDEPETSDQHGAERSALEAAEMQRCVCLCLTDCLTMCHIAWCGACVFW